MGTIKDDKICLEQLLNTLSPVKQDSVQDNISSIVDNTGNTALEPEPIFTFDAKSEMKAMKKKARKTIQLMVEHVLPKHLLNEEYIINKMDQDVDTLADLYWQVRSNTLMQNALLETVGKGNTMPRNFEVFAGLTEKISALNKQIQVAEATLRKTYIDLKLEIYDKANEEEQPVLGISGGNYQQIEDPNHNIVTGTSKLIELLQYKKMKELQASQNQIDEQ